MNRTTDQRGFALPTAIGALVIVGVLVTAGFYVAQQELRIGVASKYSAMAVNLAQTATNDVLVNQTSAISSLAVWGDTTVVETLDQGVVTVDITRLASRLFLVSAEAEVTEGGALWSGATRRVGVVTRLTSANMEPPAALATQGSLKVGGSSEIDGHDSHPASWASYCDSTSMVNKPGIAIDDTTNMSYAGTSYSVDGDPAIAQDTTLTVESLLDFGDMTWDDLVALAEIRFTSSETITGTAADSVLVGTSWRCNTADVYNWGDPLNPGAVCGNYFPIIHAEQDLKIASSGYGQGILLVEGDLAVQGGFTFFGPVYVKGELATAGTGGHFNGGVVAANVDLDTSSVLGNAVVSFSTCAIERAVLNNSALTRVRPLAMRSWVDLSAVLHD